MADEDKIPKWINTWGTVILTLLSTQWPTVLSAVLAILGTAWSLTFGFVQNPYVVTAAFLFLFFLWTWIGLTVLWDRKVPVVVTPAQDYRYGLTFDGIVPAFDGPPNEEVPVLGFGVQLKNYLQFPLKYTVTKFDAKINNRNIPEMKPGSLTSIMARGASRVSSPEFMPVSELKDFFGTKVKGKIELEIEYGHPEREPERKLSMTVEFFLTLNMAEPLGSGPNNLVFNTNIKSESDTAIDRKR